MVAGSQTRVVSECDMRFITIGSCSFAMFVVISECLKLAQSEYFCACVCTHTLIRVSLALYVCTYNIICIA